MSAYLRIVLNTASKKQNHPISLCKPCVSSGLHCDVGKSTFQTRKLHPRRCRKETDIELQVTNQYYHLFDPVFGEVGFPICDVPPRTALLHCDSPPGSYLLSHGYPIYRSLTLLSGPQIETNLDGLMTKSEFEKSMIMLTNNVAHKMKSVPPSASDPTSQGKPSEEQLICIKNRLTETLPKFFKTALDCTVYHNNLIFENNFRGTRTVGLPYYARDMALLKMIGHMKFSMVYLDILKITHHVEDGTIRLRWRIRGISGLRMLKRFWKVKVWKYQDIQDDFEENWFDGFSVFFVASDGLIHKHVADKMMPDGDFSKASPDNLAAKFALLLGLSLDKGGFLGSEAFNSMFITGDKMSSS